MAKNTREYFDVYVNIPWTQVEDSSVGVMEKILSIDEDGNKTRLLKYPSMKAGKLCCHEFWEETFILQGSLYDAKNDVSYLPGYYACRPPGMKHGPFSSPTGCLMLEIHYYKE